MYGNDNGDRFLAQTVDGAVPLTLGGDGRNYYDELCRICGRPSGFARQQWIRRPADVLSHERFYCDHQRPEEHGDSLACPNIADGRIRRRRRGTRLERGRPAPTHIRWSNIFTNILKFIMAADAMPLSRMAMSRGTYTPIGTRLFQSQRGTGISASLRACGAIPFGSRHRFRLCLVVRWHFGEQASFVGLRSPEVGVIITKAIEYFHRHPVWADNPGLPESFVCPKDPHCGSGRRTGRQSRWCGAGFPGPVWF